LLTIVRPAWAAIVTTGFEREKVMADRPFQNPLLAKIDDTDCYVVRSAWEALEYLQKYWRGSRGLLYKRAVSLSRDAVDGWVSAEMARLALKQALQSEHLWIHA
jgi:hypothetical protein